MKEDIIPFSDFPNHWLNFAAYTFEKKSTYDFDFVKQVVIVKYSY